MPLFRRSRTKQLEKKAKQELKASGEYGKSTEVTQEKVSGGARRSYNKTVRKHNKSLKKGWENPGTKPMSKMKRGAVGTEEKQVKMSRKDRKAQVSNKAKTDYKARIAARKATVAQEAKDKAQKATVIATNKSKSNTTKESEAKATKTKLQTEAKAKWDASGGLSNVKVKSGEFTKTLTKSEIAPHNKKLRLAAFKKAKKKNPKGGTFTFEGFNSKGEKVTRTGKYGNQMTKN